MALVVLACTASASTAAVESKPMAPPVNTRWTEKDPWLSPDGHTLYFASDRAGGDFNLYQTQWDGSAWSEPAGLGPLINSEHDEVQPSLSSDGHFMAFVSHRGRFRRGVWIAARQPDSSWGKAELVSSDEGETAEAVIGPDGRSFYFVRPTKRVEPRQVLGVTFDSGRRFWGKTFPFHGEWPKNEVPGARWRFSVRDGDLVCEPTGAGEPAGSDRQERLNFVASSSLYGSEDEDDWITEGQNLVDDLEDTSWVSRAGRPVDQQWVLLALNGPVRYAPGLSRIHRLRIHKGPVEAMRIEKPDKRGKMQLMKILPENAGPGSRPRRLRILGGMDSRTLSELAVADLNLAANSPWEEISLKEPAWLRYLKVEVLAAGDPGAPYVAFNEVQAFGAGLSAPRPVHRVVADENNNITFDGKPFFPVYLYRLGSSREAADWGFNTTLETYDLAPESERLAILDHAEDLGLKVIGHVPCVDSEADRKRARNHLLAARHHPAWLGYLMSDEAGHDEATMQADERRAAFIRSFDPHHFTMLNDLYPATYPRSSKIVDVFSIDPYPHIVGQPYSYQALAVDAAYKAVGYKKPVLVVNASWGPIISPVENRLNVYLALIHGAKGISWYESNVRFDHPDHWASILRCVDEIHRLEPVLFAPNPGPDSPLLTHTRIENPSARIDTMIKEVDGEVWMLAASCEPRDATVHFSFGWGRNIAVREVMADHPEAWSLDRSDFTPIDGWPPPEDREPVREARPIALKFPACGVRIFRMKPTGPIGPHHEPRGEGSPLALVNESLQRKAAEQIKRLREGLRTAEAKEVMNRFWTQYAGRVSVEDLAVLMDEVTGDDASPEEILAGYGRLADAHPEAENWPHWAFRVVQCLVRGGKPDEARAWVDKVIQRAPRSLWRANAEALVAPASAREGHKPWVVATAVAQAPVVDGELDEPVWQKRTAFKNTVFLDASKKPQETEFAVAYDAQALYFGIKLIEPELPRILKRIDKDDREVWADDCIVLYLDPRLDYASYAQFIFNALGTKWDGWGNRRGADAGTNVAVERKVVLKGDAWQIELRIPFKDLKKTAPPITGTVWGLGLQRWRHVGGALFTVWGNEQGTSLDNRAETLGFLVFE
jgi:hypothetical protein